MANELSKVSFTQFIQTQTVQDSINKVLMDPNRVMRFMASITSAVAVNPVLKNECEPHSVLNCALLGEALNLSPSPQLGQFYMVPFDNKKENVKQAQFILGYKGFLQLGIRSGQYRHITAIEIREGELISFDPIHDKIDVLVITDPTKRKLAKTIGYYGYFELLNGFEKAFYMDVAEMELHADEYSSAFKLKTYRDIRSGKIPKEDLWKSQYSSPWYKDFDAMGRKTIVRVMFGSGYAPLSTEMARALDADEKLVDTHEDGTTDYTEAIDNAKDVSEPEVIQEAEPDRFEEIEQAGGQLDFDKL